MKRSIVLVFVLSTIAAPLHTQDLDLPYEVTRQQWLEYEVYTALKFMTDGWRTRFTIATYVDYEDGEYTLGVYMATANWENPIREAQREDYEELITETVQSVLNRYEWAEGIAIRVLVM